MHIYFNKFVPVNICPCKVLSKYWNKPCIGIYQARTALTGQTTGIYMNEDLTKARERLCYMTRLLFKDKAIAKNWTMESEAIEVTKKEDLIKYDVNNVPQEHNLL